MPNKYPEKKGWDVPKQAYKLTNWAAYNESLRSRGDITVWMSEDAIDNWYQKDRVYDGTGTPQLYTDFALITCHEIRQVYRHPLRQSQGFINSLFKAKNLPVVCPDYTSLCRRLKELNIKSPTYTKTDRPDEDVHAIAIDSTGLKHFGRGEWHQEKYELSTKASWRKLHVGVNENHYIEACVLTDRFGSEKAPVYDAITVHFPDADVVIPPRKDAVLSDKASPWRNRNLEEIKTQGRMQWQKQRCTGFDTPAARSNDWLWCAQKNDIPGMPQSYISA